tara:strand:+ start:4649 stop:5140 length:492 start_codon:yes stop_codon:yes gene_type:complete
MVMADQSRNVPKPSSKTNEKLLFLRENMTHLTNQLSMPVIEVALVVSKFIRIVLESLENAAKLSGEELPSSVSRKKPLDSHSPEENSFDVIQSFPLEKLIERVDNDRMDILDTLIRNVVNESELEFVHVLGELRQWEHNIREQLSTVVSPGGLFSPLELPEDF